MNFWKNLKKGFEHILKLDDPPHKIALGFAIGIFSAFTPFLGFHILMAVILAWLFGVSIRIAVIGTLICNPWTIPFIFGGSLFVGDKLVQSNSPITLNYIFSLADQLGEAVFLTDLTALKLFFYDFLVIAKPFAIGTITLGFLSSLMSYIVVFIVLKSLKNKKVNS